MVITNYDAPYVKPITYVSQKHIESSSLLYRYSDIKVSSQKTYFDFASESPDELRCCFGLSVSS